MVRRHAWVTFLFCLLAGLPDLYGQTTESKLAWLESLRPQERQARLIEAARKEGEDGYWTAYMTNATVTAINTRQVRKEEAPAKLEELLLDIGRRYNAIGKQYREIFPGAR